MVRKWISTFRLAQPDRTERPTERPRDPSCDVPSVEEEFRIRMATVRDVRVLAGLWREMMEFHRSLDPAFQFGPEAQTTIERHLRETIRSTGGCVFIAESGHRIVGYVLGEVQERKPIYPAGRYGFISDLAVTEARRRQGIGRALVEALLSWFKRHGVTAIELFILETNPVSTAFWESMGFRHYLRLLRRDLSGAAPNLRADERAE